jgi:hypothetical protein
MPKLGLPRTACALITGPCYPQGGNFRQKVQTSEISQSLAEPYPQEDEGFTTDEDNDAIDHFDYL